MNIQLGDFITIAFGSKATCPARVEGFTKTGKLIIRRFNKSYDHWYANTAKIDRDLVISEYAGPVIMFKKIADKHEYIRETREYITTVGGPLPELK